MANPYESPDPVEVAPTQWSEKRLYAWAGGWLVIAGILHAIALNVVSIRLGAASMHWSPMWLCLLGVLVLFQLRIAIGLARLIGSLTIISIILLATIVIAGFEPGSMHYGDFVVDQPQPWHILAMLLAVALTFLPPWWLLQRAIRFDRANSRLFKTDETDARE